MFSLPHRSPRDLPFVTDHTALLLVDMQRAWLEPQFDPHLDAICFRAASDVALR